MPLRSGANLIASLSASALKTSRREADPLLVVVVCGYGADSAARDHH
ncbi:MAG: hypothetical protein WCL71_10825 [Deltaproteobacteria bacterium]